MSLLWLEGFDHYGVDELLMTDGVWSEIATSAAHGLSTVQARTGSYSFKYGGSPGHYNRRQFGSSLEYVGCGYAFFIDQLPGTNNMLSMFQFRDSANALQLTITMQSTGAIAAFRGTEISPTVIDTSTVLAVANAWSHIECFTRIHDTLGSVEVRLNGVTILNLTGVDTKTTAIAGAAQIAFGHTNGAGSSNTIMWQDDLYAWDTLGTQNNSFLGDKKVYLVLPDSDTIEADWSVVGASAGNAAINEVAPDDAVSYLEAITPPVSGELASQFGLTNLPDEVSAIAGVYAMPRVRKTDAGVANFRAGMVSNSVEAQGLTRPMTTAYTYWPDVYELDPNTGAPWTKAGFNASTVRLVRMD